MTLTEAATLEVRTCMVGGGVDGNAPHTAKPTAGKLERKVVSAGRRRGATRRQAPAAPRP